MSGETSGQKSVKRFTGKAVGRLESILQSLLGNSTFGAVQSNAQNLAEQPLSLGPEQVELAKANQFNAAQEGAHGQLNQAWDRAGAAGSFRSGSTRQDEQRVSQGLGSQLASISRGIDLQAALQRPQDIALANNVANQALQLRYQPERDIANAWLGVSGNPIWAQPSPLTSALGGVGAFGGSILGAAAGNPAAPLFGSKGGGGGAGGYTGPSFGVPWAGAAA
jgi:hypothetical protein